MAMECGIRFVGSDAPNNLNTRPDNIQQRAEVIYGAGSVEADYIKQCQGAMSHICEILAWNNPQGSIDIGQWCDPDITGSYDGWLYQNGRYQWMLDALVQMGYIIIDNTVGYDKMKINPVNIDITQVADWHYIPDNYNNPIMQPIDLCYLARCFDDMHLPGYNFTFACTYCPHPPGPPQPPCEVFNYTFNFTLC